MRIESASLRLSFLRHHRLRTFLERGKRDSTNLAVTLVDHMLPHGVHALVLLPLPVAVETDVSDGDLLTQVEDESRDVDEVLLIRNEESMSESHVLEGIFLRLSSVRAEETRRWREPRSSESDFGVDRLGDLLLRSVGFDGERRRCGGSRDGLVGGVGVEGGDDGSGGGLDEGSGSCGGGGVGRTGSGSGSRGGRRRSGSRSGRIVRGDLVLLDFRGEQTSLKKSCGFLEFDVSMLLGLDVSSVSSLGGEGFAEGWN